MFLTIDDKMSNTISERSKTAGNLEEVPRQAWRSGDLSREG